jgi:hypothetical protein
VDVFQAAVAQPPSDRKGTNATKETCRRSGHKHRAPDVFGGDLPISRQFLTITVKKYPNLERFGQQAGKPNENFLNTELFVKAFLKPCEAVRSRIGLVMFEFSKFWPTDYEHVRDFIADCHERRENPPPRDWESGCA